MIAHKDSPPQLSIQAIKALLCKYEIILEEKWHSFGDLCFSLRLFDKQFNWIGTNGKGFNKEYALASGYGEFIERLHNRFLYLTCPKIYDTAQIFSDSLDRKQLNTYELHSFSMSDACKNTDDVFVPFACISDKRIEYLPLNYLRVMCTSNGCCSGNTPEEAISQGICEIIERYVAREFYYRQLSAPDIPKLFFRDPQIIDVLEYIQSRGYTVILKDCSIGGKFPVIGLILISEKAKSYKVKFGCDTVLDVALQRCLTEILQGMNDNSLLDSFSELDFELIDNTVNDVSTRDSNYGNFVRTSRGHFPWRMLQDEGKVCFDAFSHDVDHKKIIEELYGKITDMGWKLYIRDVSYLGFPSYQVYIPEISEFRRLTCDSYTFLLTHKQNYIRTLFNLKQSNELELLDLAKALEIRLALPYHSISDFYKKLLGIELQDSTSIILLSPYLLLCIVYTMMKQYKKAYLALRNIRPSADSSYDALLKSLSDALYLANNLGSAAKALDLLSGIYDQSTLTIVREFLNEPTHFIDIFIKRSCFSGSSEFCPLCLSGKITEKYSELFKKVSETYIDQSELFILF